MEQLFLRKARVLVSASTTGPANTITAQCTTVFRVDFWRLAAKRYRLAIMPDRVAPAAMANRKTVKLFIGASRCRVRTCAKKGRNGCVCEVLRKKRARIWSAV